MWCTPALDGRLTQRGGINGLRERNAQVVSSLLHQTPVVILAGGLGTRLRSALPHQPKGLAPIGDHSFLEIQIDLFRKQGARHFVLCVGYQAAKIQAALGDGQAVDVHIDYSVEGARLLGTAGALKLAERFFAPRAIVVNGDTYFALDYERLLRHHLANHKQHGVVATLSLAAADDGARYGSVFLDDAEQFVTGFREKDSVAGRVSHWLSAGAYVLERELLDLVPSGQPCSLEVEVFPRALGSGARIAAFTAGKRFFDIGTPESWKAFTDYYLEMRHGEHAEVDSTAH
jgi:NDP-sugar pyrophosphorylase family protein